MRTTASDFLSLGGVSLAAIGEGLPNIDASLVPVRPAPWWLRTLWRPRVQGMATPSNIYIRAHRFEDPSDSAGLVLHELVHIAQWQGLGRLRFVARYLKEFVGGLFQHRNFRKAYSAISLEVEADTVSRQILQRRGPR